MGQNQNTWLDDPEWEELRQKTNKRQSKKRHNNAVDSFSAPPQSVRPSFPTQTVPRRNSTAFLKQPSNHDISRSVSGKASLPPPKPNHDAYEEPRDDRPVQVSINLSLPSFEHIKPHAQRLKRIVRYRPGKRAVTAAGLVVIVVVAATIIPKTLNKNDTKGVLSEKTAKPTFTVAEPKDQSTDQTQTNFDPDKKVASFSDQINGIKIVISEQQLPEKFKADRFGELEKLATSFNATESFDVNDGKAYIGTSVKGPQSIVMVKKDLLIFLYADRKIDNKSWIEYIEKLKT